MVTEETTAQAVEAEAQKEPEPSLDEIQTKLNSTIAELENVKKERDAQTKSASKQAAEAKRARNLQSQVDILTAKLDANMQMVADIIDRDSEDGKRRSENYLTTVREKEQKVNEQSLQEKQQEIQFIANDIISLTTKAGMEFDKSPELKVAYLHWKAGDFEEAREEVKKVVSNKTEAVNVEPEDKRIERMVAERIKAAMEERGLLDTETGKPAGGGKTFTQNQIDNMSPEEYKDNRDDIMKAITAGRIK